MSNSYVPSRGDIIWLDFEPVKGKEIGEYRPALVLSSKAYHQQTGLLICCPVSTSIRGASTEVPVNNLDQPSVVASSLVQTLSWKQRKAQFIIQSEIQVVEQVLLRLLPLMGADKVLEQYLD